MFEKLKSGFRDFARTRPGTRFGSRYTRARDADRGLAHRTLMAGLGALIFAAGLVMLVAPGPGLLAMLAGASLIAQESRILATRLDRAELRLRRYWTKLRTFWRRKASPGAKVLLVASAVCMLAALAFCAFEILKHYL